MHSAAVEETKMAAVARPVVVMAQNMSGLKEKPWRS